MFGGLLFQRASQAVPSLFLRHGDGGPGIHFTEGEEGPRRSSFVSLTDPVPLPPPPAMMVFLVIVWSHLVFLSFSKNSSQGACLGFAPVPRLPWFLEDMSLGPLPQADGPTCCLCHPKAKANSRLRVKDPVTACWDLGGTCTHTHPSGGLRACSYSTRGHKVTSDISVSARPSSLG